jgi:beta-lactamase superfamily II metal-dependent hydrolase
MATTKKSTPKAPAKRARKPATKKLAKKRAAKKAGGNSTGEAVSAGAFESPLLDAKTMRVRMYRVGFGDCFLVSLPNGARSAESHSHILIDCGVHGKGGIGTMASVVEQIAADTGKKLAVVIATHAHQDHISGFDVYGDKFCTFDIGEVWLPWTWDPKDKKAIKLQKNQAALADQLDQHFSALAATKARNISQAAADAVANLKGNARAIALLKCGFGVTSNIRYLRAGDTLGGDEGPAKNALPVPGLNVQLLGPPESDEFLAQMNPPKDQHYLRLVEGTAEVANRIQPFPPRMRLAAGDPLLAHLQLSATDAKALQGLTAASLEELAFALDKARNNESLVTLMVFRGQYLLFPGDAQYGNWRWWLENQAPDDILPRITFFKVAHHGSENATPVKALEAMSEGEFAAMVSTQRTPFPTIPRVPLMARLNEKTKNRIVRSDWVAVADAPEPAPGTEPVQPKLMPKGFVRGPLWIDYLYEL